MAGDGNAGAAAAIAIYKEILKEPFFAVRNLPSKWEKVIVGWVNGTAFSEILKGRAARDAQRTQTLVQDGIVFRLVWAIEAVRVQAIATNHARAGELGDGPAFALTYGVPSIAAALLCQIGFSSRVGAVWVTRQLAASFTDIKGLRDWLRQHDALLSDEDFWETDDMYTLWKQTSSVERIDHPKLWNRTTHIVPVDWTAESPAHGTQVRIIARNDRSGTICSIDLTPLGTAQFPFNPHGVSLDGSVGTGGEIRVAYFGRA